jgi:hypothetical protein
VLDLQIISAMYALGLWLLPSDEIRLYVNDMQRSYTEYGIETRIEPTEAVEFILFLFYTLLVLNMNSKHLALQVIKYV